jgi:acyl carrier protein
MENLKLREKIKEMMIEELMLDQAAKDIDDRLPIFGASGLSLDSVDALQLVVALEKHFGLKLGNSDQAKSILESVETIAQEIEKST